MEFILEDQSQVNLLIAGTPETGGGAGGRMSIRYSTSSEFTGTWQAYGGRSQHSDGGAGTVYVRTVTKRLLYVDNGRPYIGPVSYNLIIS